MIKFFEKAPYAPVEYLYDVEEVLYKGKSKFQEIRVIRNPYFGKMLILDDVVQLTERDEFFYHEMLTHVVMHAHPCPKKVIVIGGGDGGVVREVLKHKTVEKVYFVEIDEEVINVSRRFFPNVASGVDDSRVEIKIMDGAEFVIKRKSSDIDAVIIDSTDIIGFARSLFTPDFFTSVKNCLTDEGMFVTHTESLHFHKDMVIEIQEMLKTIFPVIDLYTASIATYPGNWWAFAVASKSLSPREARHKLEITTKYYDEEIHEQAFMPKGLYEKLMQRKLEW
ncbi:MAG TPA: polyamine aminopropyltransferase [Thermodesulfovibrionales bacterium]|nr:polyamine aminopropyltransferase [Thermodesulfovibrionales bacterium]